MPGEEIALRKLSLNKKLNPRQEINNPTERLAPERRLIEDLSPSMKTETQTRNKKTTERPAPERRLITNCPPTPTGRLKFIQDIKNPTERLAPERRLMKDKSKIQRKALGPRT